jgi:hypothetical protein
VKLLRTLAVPFLVLGLAASCGKKTPEGTTPPGETGAVDAGSGGSDAGATGAGDGGSDAGGGEAGDSGGTKTDGGDPPAEGPDPSKVCDAEVSDTPKALFADNVLIRLPKGVDLVEQTPFFARITSSNTMSTCDAIVSFAAIGYFQTDPSKSPTVIRDETMVAARGIQPSEITWSEETTKGTDYMGAYSIPEGKKGEPAIKGWISFKQKGGNTFWVAYETHPNAWNAVKKSFQESTKRLIIIVPK